MSVRTLGVPIGLALVLCACGDVEEPTASGATSTDRPTESTQTEPESTAEIDLVAEIDQLLSSDPDLCATEMPGAIAMLEDAVGGAHFDHVEARAVIEEICADFEPPDAQPDPEPEYAAFGDTWTWSDGIESVIEGPEKYEPSEGVEVESAEAHVMFTITVTNNSGEPFDPSLGHVTVQSGGREAEEVFDSANGIVGGPEGTLIDGRSVSWDAAFGVLDPKDIVLEFTPSFDHESGIYILE